MQTITTREQLLVNGKVLERVATHIVTGAHGYETLCTGGYNLQYNQERVLVQNCEKLAEGEPRQPGGCKLKTAPVRPVVAARPAEYVCSEDLFY